MSEPVLSHHPGSRVLRWWQTCVKDEDGYAYLSDLVQNLDSSTQIRGTGFLKRVSSQDWQEKHGWSVNFHAWKPNKIRVETRPGSSLALEIPQGERK